MSALEMVVVVGYVAGMAGIFCWATSARTRAAAGLVALVSAVWFLLQSGPQALVGLCDRCMVEVVGLSGEATEALVWLMVGSSVTAFVPVLLVAMKALKAQRVG